MAATRSWLLVAASTLVAATLGCARWMPAPHQGQPGEQPYDRSTVVTFDTSGVTRRVKAVPLGDYGTRLAGPDRPTRSSPASPRIHPLLVDWLRDSSAAQRIEAVLTFEDPIEIPRFPDPRLDESRGSTANLAALAVGDSLTKSVIGRRAPTYAADSSELAHLDGAQVLRTFWIIRAMKVRIALGSIPPLLARREDITYIAPNESGEPPPSVNCGAEGAVPALAYELMHAGFLRRQKSHLPWMSLLDCGIDTKHQAFTPSGSSETPRLGRVADCRNPGCAGGNTMDESCDGHGTASAAILVGLPFPNECAEGMVSPHDGLDVFRVFDNGSACTDGPASHFDAKIRREAVLDAFQQSVPKLDRIIVCETQAFGLDGSDIASAANQAYNAGAAVVGAQGNVGAVPGAANPTVENRMPRSPGNARRAIAAGGYNVADPKLTRPCLFGSQCFGPTPDGRIKPDVLGPTATHVASLDNGFANLGGTSGATPYVAGALALLRSQLADPSEHVDPGQLYAALLACGEETWSEDVEGSSCLGSLSEVPEADLDGFHPARGTGKFFLPDSACLIQFARISLVSNSTHTVKIDLGHFKAKSLDAAVWWPDRQGWSWSCVRDELAEWWQRTHPGVPQPNWPTDPPQIDLPDHLDRALAQVPRCRVEGIESDIDLEIASPSDPALAWTAHSVSKKSVFERAGVNAHGGQLASGIWQVRIVGAHVPIVFPAMPQTVYYAIIARP